MNKEQLIAHIEGVGPFYNNLISEGKCRIYEPARCFLLSCLKGDIEPAFVYKNPVHIGYRYSASHLHFSRLCDELGIGEFVNTGLGIYATTISFNLN